MRITLVGVLLLALSTAFAAVVAAGAARLVTLAEVRHTGVDYHFSGIVPKWSGGAFITVNHDAGLFPEISTYGRNGRRLSRTIFEIPEAGNIRICGVARASSGVIAAAGGALDNSDRGIRYLALLTAEGKLSCLVRTGPFVPTDVEVASDGSIWVVGWEATEDGHEKPEYMMVRRYNPSGEEVGAYLPRSTVKRHPTYPHPTSYSFLLSAYGRMGWYSNAAGEYIEFSNDGQITSRVAGVAGRDYASPPAGGLCGDGTLYVSLHSGPKGEWQVWTLDRSVRTWKEVSFKESFASPWRQVFGCDEEGLVMNYSGPESGRGLVWLRPAEKP